ncbi:MAG TPA: pitrilysin family protein, partial [Gemmatimonadaceae bacterium]|nr:pitrilysin family protein [Gemmatimonadaceae bacterium]
FARGLEVQADAFANSVIDGGELARELEVIIEEAKRKSDNASAVATESFYELIHDAHRIRRWRIGHEAGLRQFTRQTMLDFYRNFYRPNNTILCISGDVDGGDVLTKVESLYGSLERAEIARSPGPGETGARGFRYRELSGDVGQSQLLIGWNTPPTAHRATPALDVAASILGVGRASRLYRAVRERKLGSSVSAYNYTPTQLGVFVLHAECEPENTAAAARAMWDQARSLRDHPVDESELTRVRSSFEARWVRRLETAEGRANHLAEWEALGGWELAEGYFDRFLSVSAEEVREAANRYLPAESAGALVYRPRESAPIAEGAGDMLRVLEGVRPPQLSPVATRAAILHRSPNPVLEERVNGVSVYRTAGGVPVLVRRKAGPMAHVAVHVAGGAVEERAARAGLTMLTARAMTKGTTTRSAAQIAEDGELLGGGISASAGGDSFGWSLSVPGSRLAQALELLGDVVQQATIPVDAFETERAVALSGLAMMRDDMFRYPMRLANSLAFEGHPYGVPVSGTEETLRALSAEHAREWHRDRVLRSAAVIGVVADLPEDEVAHAVCSELAAIELAEIPLVEPPRWGTRVATASEDRDKAQTALVMAFPAPARTDGDRFAATMLATIASGLGGRFFDELRDRQSLAYTVHAGVSEKRLAGVFVTYIATSPEKEEVARAGLLAEIEKFRMEPVTDGELRQATEYLVGTHAISRESGASVLGEILDAWIFGGGLSELEDYESRVRSVTARDVQEVARRYLDPDIRVEGIVRGGGRTV